MPFYLPGYAEQRKNNILNYHHKLLNWPIVTDSSSPEIIKSQLSGAIKCHWVEQMSVVKSQGAVSITRNPGGLSSKQTDRLTEQSIDSRQKKRQTDIDKDRDRRTDKDQYKDKNRQTKYDNKIKLHDQDKECSMCKDQQRHLDKQYNPDNNHYIDVTHKVTNFVDDSTSNIGLTNRTNIEPYIKTYLDLLHNYYTINTLTMNKLKTKYTIIGTSQQVADTRRSTIKLGQDKLNCDGQVRILGMLISSDNTLNSAIDELLKNINFRLFNLNKVKKHTDFESRRKFVLSFLIGCLNYFQKLILYW